MNKLKNILSERVLLGLSLVLNVMIVLVLLVGGIYLVRHRGSVFRYLASDYTSPQEVLSKGGFFTQDSLVTSAVEKANPAVVSIAISKNVPIYVQDNTPDNGRSFDFFGFPFDLNVPQLRQKGTQKQEVGGGSGFIVSPQGLIVTNRHVISEKDASYAVFTNDGKKYDVKVIAQDPVLDIAVLKISSNHTFPYLTFGDSSKLKLGQTVIAIGNALGEFRNSVSVGVVSGLSRSIVAGDYSGSAESLDQVIQTDAAINPGNSGGPLLDLNANVVGVNVAVAQGSESVGFALPVDTVKSAVISVERSGEIIRPYLGVRYQEITDALQEEKKLPVNYGVLVSRGENASDVAVISGSPAGKVGIVEGDIILEVDGVKLDDTNSLASLIRKKSVGDTTVLKIIHKGKETTIKVILEKFKE